MNAMSTDTGRSPILKVVSIVKRLDVGTDANPE